MLKEILEKELITVYHGGNQYFTKIDPKYMLTDNSNAQEGIGIYFAENIETAKGYGDKIVYTEIDKSKFIDSQDFMSDYINDLQLEKFAIEINKICQKNKNVKEKIFYSISNWIEIYEPDDVNEYNILDYLNNIIDEEVRNFQIELAENIGVVNFVNIWNKLLKNIHGTFQKQGKGDTFYAIINTNYKIKKFL